MAIQQNGQPASPLVFLDNRPGSRVFIGETTPTTAVDGDIWFDSDVYNNAGKNFIFGIGLSGASTNLSISAASYKDIYIVFRNVQSTANATLSITLNNNTTNYAPGPSTAMFTLANVKTGVTTNHWAIEIPDIAANAFKWGYLKGVYTNSSNSVILLDTTAAFTSTDALSTMTISASAGTLSGTALIYGVN